MSCWVVPTIAAEIWGVGVEHILQRVRDGELPYRIDQGFMFVDVEGSSCAAAPGRDHPPTFTGVLLAAEVETLGHDDEHDGEDAFLDEVLEERLEEDQTQSPDNDEASAELGDWRAVRQRVAMTRIPPGRAKPQAA